MHSISRYYYNIVKSLVNIKLQENWPHYVTKKYRLLRRKYFRFVEISNGREVLQNLNSCFIYERHPESNVKDSSAILHIVRNAI